MVKEECAEETRDAIMADAREDVQDDSREVIIEKPGLPILAKRDRY